MATAGVHVENWRSVNAAFAKADRESRLALKAKQRQLAVPVRMAAEGLAHDKITRITDKWAQMRIGVTKTVVYVAPKQRGLKGDDPRKRRNLAPLLMEQAMEPALEQNRPQIEQKVERILDWVADDFNH
jgi:hypothetical protein